MFTVNFTPEPGDGGRVISHAIKIRLRAIKSWKAGQPRILPVVRRNIVFP